MGNDLGIDEWRASLIAMITQVGYACGLFFIIPSGDKFDRKKIVSYSFSILTIALLCIALSNNFHAVMAASFTVGACSVMPQIFIPIAAQYSRPEKRGANVGLIVSGLLTGILASRVISGLVGEWLGWRSMYVIAAIVMSLCTLIVWRIMPYTENNYTGSYKRLMHSLFALIREYKLLRICALRAAFAFGSFLALWASLTFKMEQAPFYAGSDVVGLLGLCGVAGAMSASVVGRLVSRIGVRNFNLLGAALMLSAWIIAYLWGNTYTAIIITILILDIGMQCIQLSQSDRRLFPQYQSIEPDRHDFHDKLFHRRLFGNITIGKRMEYGWLERSNNRGYRFGFLFSAHHPIFQNNNSFQIIPTIHALL